jgi:putative cell wall-binding protein
MVHKHVGVLTSIGSLRPHNLSRKHSDIKVQEAHNKVLSGKEQEFWQGEKKNIVQKITEKITQPQQHNGVLCGIDKEGYINIDLDNSNSKGIRIKFTRVEGRTRRRVGLQIENKK